jgi:hypothetical protein
VQALATINGRRQDVELMPVPSPVLVLSFPHESSHFISNRSKKAAGWKNDGGEGLSGLIQTHPSLRPKTQHCNFAQSETQNNQVGLLQHSLTL